MKPKSPFIQTFDRLPELLPIYTHKNVLLPGGELPLELTKPDEISVFIKALKTDQLIGIVQPDRSDPTRKTYLIGGSGRIRQYRERKDGRLNLMLTGVCRFKIDHQSSENDDFIIAKVDWSGFEKDYSEETVDSILITHFKEKLRNYFDQHRMSVDWKVLDENPIEHVVNNLILVINLDTESKQRLLESVTTTQRLELFTKLLENKSGLITAPAH